MQTVRKYLVWAVFCCFALGVRSAGAKIFDMEEFRLDNGLQVIVIPNRKAPIVRQMVWYRAAASTKRWEKAVRPICLNI